MELRIYAEDPDNDFMPSGGYVSFYKEPSMPGVRCDGWLYSGCYVPSKYDPLLLKLIVKGESRDETINKTLIALDELKIQGIKNNIPFFKFVLNLPEFREGNINTWSMKDILEKYKEHKRALYLQDMEHAIVLGAYLCSNGTMQEISHNQYQENLKGGWKVSGWKINGRILRREQLR
jgi:Acetyl/propionyl-CoA carboxylase, alpha subunit